jgi:hypothetical protein
MLLFFLNYSGIFLATTISFIQIILCYYFMPKKTRILGSSIYTAKVNFAAPKISFNLLICFKSFLKQNLSI